MFKRSNFCHVASNNRNNVKSGVFIYRTTDNLATVSANGYFNDMIIDINLHDLIIHEQIDTSDNTKVERNLLCVTAKTLDNINTVAIKSKWEGDIEQAIADLETYINNNFVKIDGSSVMSAPLKFASGSFRGAVGPGLNGVTFLKMDSDGNITLVGSLSDTQFIPSGDNTTDLGNSTRKLKTVYANNLNNGYDIAIPVTHATDTVGLKSQIDDAANSGEQLYTTGVWYAKMYAGTTAPSADNGTNYADFSQVDNNNKPIIVIYTRTNGAWVETTRITPPANHNGYMTITSKIWDIAEQAGQQGGLVLWSHNQETFTPYPRIVSFDGANITNSTITTSTFQGSATLSDTSTVTMPASSSDSQIVNKKYVDDLLSSNFANRDLSNLTSTGQNISNWSSNVSNCITNIPQDIKLELSGGTLTLKAGSKVYVPNGAGVFTAVTLAADRTGTGTGNEQALVYYSPSLNSLIVRYASKSVSGSTRSLTTTYMAWYDTTNNVINDYHNNASTPRTTMSFPVALVTLGASGVESIDQVFNGFGYIGAAAFVLPGVKCLIPDGRKTDGTLNSILKTITSVRVSLQDTSTNSYENYPIVLEEVPDSLIPFDNYYYDEKDNYVKSSSSHVVPSNKKCIVGFQSWDKTSGKITSFVPKQVFHAVDSNESDFVVAFQRPTSANNYTWYRKYKSGWVEQGGANPGTFGTVNLPVEMADAYYNVTITPSNVQIVPMITARNTTSFVASGRNIDNGQLTGTTSFVSWQVSGMAQG